jgi:hypothetical protein
MSRWWLILGAVIIGISVVAVDELAFTALTGRPLTFASDVEPVAATIAAIPYLILASMGARRALPWIVGLTLTLSLWGYKLYSGVSYQWNPDGTGANIGLGILMLFSPIFISPVVVAVHLAQRRAPKRP